MNLPENIWNSPVIKKRLYAEAGFESNHGAPHKQHYWFLVPEADTKRGLIELSNFSPSPFDSEPHPLQIEFARELQQALQRHCHHDGLWIVGWTHPPSTYQVIQTDGDNCWLRLCMIWLDQDADPQYTLESDIPFIEMIEGGVASYLELAERSHAAWEEAYGKRAMKEDFGIKEEQTTKEALAAIH